MSKDYNKTLLMHVIGDDFHFSNATKNFQSYDLLINYVNNNQQKFNTTLIYSTPKNYIDRVK